MGCVERGELRAFQDGALAEVEMVRVERHLAGCAYCRAGLDALRENALLARSAIDRLAPAASEVPMPQWSRVRERAEERIRRPVTFDWGLTSMFGNLLRLVGGSRLRMATSVAATLVVVALLFTLSPVQTMASSFLSIFRVQKFVAVQVDPSSVPKELASPQELGTIRTTGDTKARLVTLSEAEQAVGFRVPVPATLPAGLEPQPRAVMLNGAGNVTFVPDLKKVRAYLSTLGATDVKLPDNLDGATITMQMPARVQVLYLEKGGVERSADGMPRPLVGQRFLYVGATTSPTLSVPDGLDVGAIRSELLKVPGLPPDLVSQLKAIQDWQSTVVVPVVKGTSRDVTVQGEKGLLVVEPDGKGTSLIWMKGGVIYALSGSVSEAEILAAANSMR